MSGLTNYKALPIQNVPYKANVVEQMPMEKEWTNWARQTNDLLEHHNNLTAQNALINSDFHWSRTNENKPTLTDGEFVEGWFVKGGEMKFVVTPKYYTNTDVSSQTGSDRYINVKINTINQNQFEIYQKLPKTLSYFHNKTLVVSGLVQNNFGSQIKAKCNIAFDTNNDGTFEFSADSNIFYIGDTTVRKPFAAQITTPNITEDNRNNTQYVRLVLFDLVDRVDFNLYFLKAEFNNLPTSLFIDHTIEKLKLDDIKP